MSVTSVILSGFDWFLRITKLNLVWFFSCLAGLLVFSFFPATVAAFSVTKKWTEGNVDVSVWETFKKTFKIKYWRAQLTGSLLSLGFLILYVDIQFFRNLEGELLKNAMLILLAFLLFIFVTITLYIFPIIVQSNLRLNDLFKNALFTGLSYLHWTIINIAGAVGIVFVSYLFPASFLFLTGGGIILWVTCMSKIVRRKIELKYNQLHSVSE